MSWPLGFVAVLSPATLVWGARSWLAPAALLAVVALGVLAWSYAGAVTSRQTRWLALLLKATGIVLLALVLLDPLWASRRARPGENIVLVLADTSQSMTLQGDSQQPTLAQRFGTRLEDEAQPWLVRLKQDFDVRRFTFDNRLEPRSDFAKLEFNGPRSSLHAVLSSIGERFRGRPIAGVVLFTDGVATDAALQIEPSKLPPIYPVLPPELKAAADVRLDRVTATNTNFEDAPITVLAEAAARGGAVEPLVCQVLDERGKIVKTAEQTLDDRGATTFRFQFRPEREGVSFYRVRVAAKSQLGVWQKPTEHREATLANNERLVMVDRQSGPYRILYVGGAPNPEHKFIVRSLAEDTQVELVSLMRIARREPKFDFRTRAGETSNPLFRGFGKTDDETERYDQPVFVRLGIKDDRELRDGFPKTAEQLFAYHAIILDDVEASFFSADQMLLLDKFVSTRGGGLLMLGGPDSFEKGAFAKTPLADVLPVYLQRVTAQASPSAAGFRWNLTREGWLEPWLRLRGTETEERQRLDTMPPFRALNRVSGIKPGATLLATATDSQGSAQPALVVQPYGRGRSGALLIGDLWRWRLKLEPENQDLEKMWRQLIRWLTADVAGQVGISSELTQDDLVEGRALEVRVRDAAYQPQDNAQTSIEVTPPDGKKLTLDAEPSRREPGVYASRYVPRQPGAYRATAKVRDDQGRELAAVETGWTFDPSAEEFRALKPDRAALVALAKQTNGEPIELSGLDDFAAGLAARPAPETVQTLFPLWHTPWIFALAIACLAGEWGLRRWKGLP